MREMAGRKVDLAVKSCLEKYVSGSSVLDLMDRKVRLPSWRGSYGVSKSRR